MEETSRRGIFGSIINLAIRKGLTFYQTRSNALILQETLPACCIPKVVRLKTGEVLYGKPKCVNALTAAGLDTAFTARDLRTKPDKHHPTAQGGADVLQWDASPCKNLVHQHDHAGPEDSYGCKLGRSRIRVAGFWIKLDILSDRLCRRSSITAKTYQTAGQRQVGYRLENGEPFFVDVARRKCAEFDHLYKVTHGSEHRGETRKERE